MCRLTLPHWAEQVPHATVWHARSTVGLSVMVYIRVSPSRKKRCITLVGCRHRTRDSQSGPNKSRMLRCGLVASRPTDSSFLLEPIDLVWSLVGADPSPGVLSGAHADGAPSHSVLRVAVPIVLDAPRRSRSGPRPLPGGSDGLPGSAAAVGCPLLVPPVRGRGIRDAEAHAVELGRVVVASREHHRDDVALVVGEVTRVVSKTPNLLLKPRLRVR